MGIIHVYLFRSDSGEHYCGGSFCFVFWCLKYFLCCWRLMYVFIFLVKLG